MEGRPLFYGTSSKFLKGILKRGLSTVHSTGEADRLKGLNLTSSIVKALIQAGKAVKKHGGTRLVVVCNISSKHPVGEDDLRTYFLDFGWKDPSLVLYQIQSRKINLDKLIDERISLMKESGADSSLVNLLKDNKKLLASMMINFLAYKLSSKIESEDVYIPMYYPSLVFVLKRGKPVFSMGRPILKYPSDKWLAAFKKDMGRLTKLIGGTSHRLTKDDFSLRVNRVGLKGPDRIAAIFEEIELYSNVFNPVYVAPGYDNYVKLFMKKLSRYLSQFK